MQFKKKSSVTARITRLDEEELGILKKRNDVAAIIIISFIAILIARLWFLQIHNGDTYTRLSENNRVRVRDVVAPRGNILDRHGKILVTNRPSFNIVWTKEDAKQPDLVIKRMGRILGEETPILWERVRAAADNPRHLPVKLKTNIDWRTLAYVENNRHELPGISIEALPQRDYLYDGFAAHVIGYLGEINQKELTAKADDRYQQGDQIGKMGVEKLFESSLRGEKGRHYMEVDAQGFEQRRLKGMESLSGKDLSLTIDYDLQSEAEPAMAGRAGSVVALEVNTGRVLAMASAPTLSLKKFAGGIPTDYWRELLADPLRPLYNKSVMGQYPPGSTYKIIPALAGLIEGAITPETTFFCSGSLNFGNRKYHCWKRHGHGKTDMHRALAESCDVYFYQVGQKLGVDTLAKYAKALGLGQKTGIEIEHEKKGLVPTAAWKMRQKDVPWQKGETMSVVIGQGFNLTTPLQVARMMAVVVNGGILYRPQLLEAIQDSEGHVIQGFQPIIEGRLQDKDKALALIREALVAVVNDEGGTGKAARMKDIIVGGKTGTAQVVRLNQYENVAEDKIPYKYRDHAWFVGYAPAEKPEIVVAVLVEHGGHGGSTAGPVAHRVLEKYFNPEKNKETAHNQP